LKKLAHPPHILVNCDTTDSKRKVGASIRKIELTFRPVTKLLALNSDVAVLVEAEITHLQLWLWGPENLIVNFCHNGWVDDRIIAASIRFYVPETSLQQLTTSATAARKLLKPTITRPETT
jgi:hypothetical protein